MTREEEIKKAAQAYISGDILSSPSILIHFANGAGWADEHPNLERLWHDACEGPEDYFKQIIYQDKTDTCHFTTMHDIVVMLGLKWEHFAAANIIRWAYISDLLPKGGKK